jgi:hypothetical protein
MTSPGLALVAGHRGCQNRPSECQRERAALIFIRPIDSPILSQLFKNSCNSF